MTSIAHASSLALQVRLLAHGLGFLVVWLQIQDTLVAVRAQDASNGQMLVRALQEDPVLEDLVGGWLLDINHTELIGGLERY